MFNSTITDLKYDAETETLSGSIDGKDYTLLFAPNDLKVRATVEPSPIEQFQLYPLDLTRLRITDPIGLLEAGEGSLYIFRGNGRMARVRDSIVDHIFDPIPCEVYPSDTPRLEILQLAATSNTTKSVTAADKTASIKNFYESFSGTGFTHDVAVERTADFHQLTIFEVETYLDCLSSLELFPQVYTLLNLGILPVKQLKYLLDSLTQLTVENPDSTLQIDRVVHVLISEARQLSTKNTSADPTAKHSSVTLTKAIIKDTLMEYALDDAEVDLVDDADPTKAADDLQRNLDDSENSEKARRKREQKQQLERIKSLTIVDATIELQELRSQLIDRLAASLSLVPNSEELAHVVADLDHRLTNISSYSQKQIQTVLGTAYTLSAQLDSIAPMIKNSLSGSLKQLEKVEEKARVAKQKADARKQARASAKASQGAVA